MEQHVLGAPRGRVGREEKQPERPGEGHDGTPGPRGSREDAEIRARSSLDPDGPGGTPAAPAWVVCPLQVPRPLSPVPSLCPLRGLGAPPRQGPPQLPASIQRPGNVVLKDGVNERMNGQRGERAHGRSSSLRSLPEDPPPCDLGPSRRGPELEGFWGGRLLPPPRSEGPQAQRLKPVGLGFRNVDAPQGDRSHCLESALPWRGPTLMHAGRFPALRPALHPRAQGPQSSPGTQLIWGRVTSPKCSEVSNCSLGTPLPLLKCRVAPGGALRYQQQVC